MNCRFNINTVDFLRALHALRRMVEYSAYFGCSAVEADSLIIFLDQMERNYHDFLHRNDPRQSDTITRGIVDGRAGAREMDSDESISASLRSIGSRLLELAEAVAAHN